MKKLRITFNSPVVLSFVLLCAAATLANSMTGGVSSRMLFMTYRAPLTSPLTYLRLFTHVLGHGGWEHFISNAAYLLLLGPMLEEKYGPEKLLSVIVVTALVTGIFHFVFFSETALCGASGVVFAFILLTSFTGFREGELPLTFLLVVLVFLGQQVADGLLRNDDISNISHILGGLVGAGFGYSFNKKSRYGF